LDELEEIADSRAGNAGDLTGDFLRIVHIHTRTLPGARISGGKRAHVNGGECEPTAAKNPHKSVARRQKASILPS
jgi:hypothetical protein